MKSSNLQYWPIPTTIAIALFLQILASPWASVDYSPSYRPDWLLLVCCYWAIAVPQKVSVTSAWVAGLLLDFLSIAPLGKNAVLIVLGTFLVQFFYKQMRLYNRARQCIVILLVSTLLQLISIWIDGALGHFNWHWSAFYSSLSNALVWPVIFPIMRYLRLTYSVR